MKGRQKSFDPSKYGLTMEQWDAMTRDERGRHLAHVRKYTTVRRRENPEKFREYERKRRLTIPDKIREKERRSYWKHHEKRLASSRARWARARTISKIRHDPDKVYLMLTKAVPRSWPRHVRDDLVSIMCLAILEGKLLIENIGKEVRRFVTEYNRVHDTYKTLSLDAVIPGTEGMTYLDQLVAPVIEGFNE